MTADLRDLWETEEAAAVAEQERLWSLYLEQVERGRRAREVLRRIDRDEQIQAEHGATAEKIQVVIAGSDEDKGR